MEGGGSSGGGDGRSQPREDPKTRRRNKYELRILRFRYRDSDDPKDAREVVLIVSALIAAVTFQAGVNPPGGVWQDNNSDRGQVAGRAIYASQNVPFYVFLVFNTLALSTSIFTIASLTHGFPFSMEIWIATVSMIVTYASSVFAITPHEFVKFRYILIVAAAPFIARALSELYYYVKYLVANDQVGAPPEPQPDNRE